MATILGNRRIRGGKEFTVVVQTTLGAGSPISARLPMPDHFACEMDARWSGHVRIAGNQTSAHHLALTKIANGDTATYRYLDFHSETAFSIRMKANDKCRVELYTNGRYHTDMEVPTADIYTAATKAVPPLAGIHTVTLKFYRAFSDAATEVFVFL